MSLVATLARPEVLVLETYPHAAWEPTLERLHANENPWRHAGDASAAGLNRYPEPTPRALEARLAALYGVAPEQLIAGRGSDESIDLLARAFLRPGRDAVLICPPTFAMYARAARIQGVTVLEVPLLREQGFALNEGALPRAATAAVKLVFFCSPNNPTGNALEAEAIERLARILAGRALVIVDEAYAEFSSTPSFVGRLGEFPNLVVLRTLSKAYALAGARCGALIAAPAIVELLRRILPPYAIPVPTSEAVLTALDAPRRAETQVRIAQLLRERDRLAVALASVDGVRKIWPSEANFLLVEFWDAAHALVSARAAGFLVRDFSSGPLTSGCLRISIGCPEQNDRLIAGFGRKGVP
jgi:histidinol-phosphate aminotransferase